MAPCEEHMVLGAVPEWGPADCSAHLPVQRKLYLGARPGFGRKKEHSALAVPSQAWLPVTSSPHPPNSTHCAPGSVHRVETILSRWLPRYITHHRFLPSLPGCCFSVSCSGFSSAACSLDVGDGQGLVLDPLLKLPLLSGHSIRSTLGSAFIGHL